MERTQYLIDSFTDYKGKKRKFVICLLSHMEHNTKVVSVGFAICHEDDEFNETVGKRKAYHTAANKDCKLKMYLSHPGLINTAIGDAILQTMASYFIKYPEFQIPGYSEMEKKWNEKIKQEVARDQQWLNLPEECKRIVEALGKLTDDARAAVMSYIND